MPPGPPTPRSLGICVSSCLGKLFCTILNDRTLNYTTENDIIHPSQIGFLPGYRTADHIFYFAHTL